MKSNPYNKVNISSYKVRLSIAAIPALIYYTTREKARENHGIKAYNKLQQYN